jgi:hypothetical protein
LPWLSSSPITGNFYFAGKPEPAAPDTKQASLTPQTPLAPQDAAAATTPAPTTELRFSPPDDPLRQGIVTDCDRLAAMPYDTGHGWRLPGLEVDKINVAAAGPACNDAMQRYPDVIRFVFESGRVATARKDYAEARRLYDQAAAAGYAMAMNNIGATYEAGYGTPVNYVEAARWYQKAVDAGEPIGMVDLGWQYETGHGVKKDYAHARQLYETAIKAGEPSAMNNLGLMHMQGEGGPRDYNESRHLYEQSAALGNDAAINGLGVLYSNGYGVARDKRKALQFFEKAAALGNPEAKENLRVMRR